MYLNLFYDTSSFAPTGTLWCTYRGSCRKVCIHSRLPRNGFASLHPHISVSFQYFQKLFHTLTLRYMISNSTKQFLFILLQYRIMSMQSWAFMQWWFWHSGGRPAVIGHVTALLTCCQHQSKGHSASFTHWFSIGLYGKTVHMRC